jgi:hypothetical protein
MCQAVTGATIELSEPKRAYKVIRGGGYLYHPPLSLNTGPDSWLSGRVFRAKPKTQFVGVFNARQTNQGLHVFWTRGAAEDYRKAFDSYVIEVLVWGKVIPFVNGGAVEFATKA